MKMTSLKSNYEVNKKNLEGYQAVLAFDTPLQNVRCGTIGKEGPLKCEHDLHSVQ